jgi:hypothetical protein
LPQSITHTVFAPFKQIFEIVGQELTDPASFGQAYAQGTLRVTVTVLPAQTRLTRILIVR